MTLGSPTVLLALAALPALAAWYVASERRRGREQAFASEPLTASVAPRRPGWRRHAAPALLVVALAGLIVAAARPQVTRAVVVDRASIVLATDVSGSMLATDVQPDRLSAARRAARRFAARVPRNVRVGVLAFNQTPAVLQAPTTDRGAVADALSSLRSSGGTATGEAVVSALRVLRGATTDQAGKAPAAIVLLSDGASTRGIAPTTAARQAKAAGIPIYTVALGSTGGTIRVRHADGSVEVKRVPPDPGTLRQMASISGGRSFGAQDASGLGQVYERLASQLGREPRKQEISSAFAGGALLLFVFGAGLSLRWFGRIV